MRAYTARCSFSGSTSESCAASGTAVSWSKSAAQNSDWPPDSRSMWQCVNRLIVALSTRPPYRSLYGATSVPPPARPSRSGARE
jgi:hypothetical protein